MGEHGLIKENEAKKLLGYGIKMAEEEGGIVPVEQFPLYHREIIGYGLSYRADGLSVSRARGVIDALAQWLEEDYYYLASKRVTKYQTPRGIKQRNNTAVKINNRDKNCMRRTEIYLIPDKLPERHKISSKKALEKAIEEGLKKNGPLTPPQPWDTKTLFKKEAEYTLEDMVGCENYTIDVKCFGPNFFDLINTPLSVGKAIAKAELDKRGIRYAKTLRALMLEKFEKTDWNDIAGLEDIKEELKLKVQGPLYNKDIFKKMPIPNTLFIGPPGTGKTMLCRALLSNLKNCNIVPFKPEFIAPFIGSSEASIGNLFELCDGITKETGQYTLFFWDEIDNTGSRFLEGGEKIVNALLRLLGGSEKYEFSIIATTNKPSGLDPALFRPGRIDWIAYIGLPKSEEREKLLEIYTKELKLDGVDLKTLAGKVEDFTGADIKGLCIEANRSAVYEASKKNIDNLSSINLEDVKITNEDFETVLKSSSGRIKEANRKWVTSFSEWKKAADIANDLSYIG